MACTMCRYFRFDYDVRTNVDVPYWKQPGLCMLNPKPVEVTRLHACGSFMESNVGIVARSLGSSRARSAEREIERTKRIALEKKLKAANATIRALKATSRAP